MKLDPGEQIDRYVVERLLGQGAMALVYQVRHATLDTVHALKVLTQTAPSIVERLVQEGKVQASLRHPNVVAVTDVFQVHGMPGLLMEYIDGPSLKEWLASCRPSLEESLRLFQGVVLGVGRAHELDIIHRDLKPGNVMLKDHKGVLEPKVADFGLAKALANFEGGMQQTRTGVAMGTPAYMAPEQIRDAKNVDTRADLFSLGAILYELVTGHLAFPGEDLFEVFSRVVAGRYTPVEAYEPDTPAVVLRAIHGCLQPDREQRISTCEGILAVLGGAQLENHVAARLAPKAAPSPRPAAAIPAAGGGMAGQAVPAGGGTWAPEADPAPLLSQPTMDPSPLSRGSLPTTPSRSQETFDPGMFEPSDVEEDPAAAQVTAVPTASSPPVEETVAPSEERPRPGPPRKPSKGPLIGGALGLAALVGIGLMFMGGAEETDTTLETPPSEPAVVAEPAPAQVVVPAVEEELAPEPEEPPVEATPKPAAVSRPAPTPPKAVAEPPPVEEPKPVPEVEPTPEPEPVATPKPAAEPESAASAEPLAVEVREPEPAAYPYPEHEPP